MFACYSVALPLTSCYSFCITCYRNFPLITTVLFYRFNFLTLFPFPLSLFSLCFPLSHTFFLSPLNISCLFIYQLIFVFPSSLLAPLPQTHLPNLLILFSLATHFLGSHSALLSKKGYFLSMILYPLWLHFLYCTTQLCFQPFLRA